MSATTQGTLVLVATLLMLMSGIPVGFGLGAISIIFLLLFHGFDSMHVVAETFWSGLDDFTLVAIPMFVMMGAAIGSSPAGKDLYEALDRWLYRVPGGLVISNLGACAIFAALTGSPPARCAGPRAMGHSGNAATRLSGRRGDRLDLRRRHARHSDSAVDHLYPLRHCHRNLDWPSVPRRRGAGPDADRPFHGVDHLYHMEARFPLPCDRFSLFLERKIPIDPEDRTVPADYFRRHVFALWRCGDAVGGGRRGRRALSHFSDSDLRTLERRPDLAHLARHDAGIGDDPDHHRCRRAVRLHAHLALPHPDVGAGDRRRAFQSLGADGDDQSLPVGFRIFHSACRHHLDDQPDPAADHHRRGLRSGVVRRDPDHQYGNRPDPSAGRPQHLYRQRDRARCAGHNCHVGDYALRPMYDVSDRDLVLFS